MKKILFGIIMGSTILQVNCKKVTESMRVATFNIWELSTEKLSSLDASGRGQNEQLTAAATIIQKVRPDILVINEIDHDYRYPDLAKNARLFRDGYLRQGDAAIDYPFVFAAPCNTGILAHADFNNDGVVADSTQVRTRLFGEDCFGYGEYPGQYSMALLSKHPIITEDVRTFQLFLWKDLPGHHMPCDFYSDDEVAIFRLSSKSHWDVPILIKGKTVHLLLCHPTPPVFDGAEDRNGRRNFDEIKFWVHYLDGDVALYDDAGRKDGFAKDEPFIIAGDLNAAPDAPASYDDRTAISQLLQHPKIYDSVNFTIRRNASDSLPLLKKTETAQFSGNRKTRIDYVLPSIDLEVIDGGVFWPFEEDDPEGYALAEKASDHRLVWIDVKI
ncbi:endonuclease/exonuclease/phosphatase family protein [candidate division KSB1 bacterium]|nr:endonuclease/exonuclease/phosphatase family protein [candidate division KSB1 bacterium]RQW08806.1 MAG: endonuclease/exonuclease/phosphatase family protein [candidate division KSB1 bacterium]